MIAALDVRRRPLLGVAGALAVAVLTVSGCSAGQNAQTVEQTSVVDGTAFEAGQVNLRDVGLRAPSGSSYAVGGTAYLEGLVVNNAAETDTLVSVTTPAAGSVAIYADGVSALLGTAPTTGATTSATPSGSSSDFATPTTNTGAPSQAGTPTSAESSSESGSTTDTASPTASGASSSASTSAAATAPLTDLPLPSDQAIQFGYSNGQIALVLTDLKVALFPAETFPITFTFANGGSVTVTIAVKIPVDSSLDAPTINTEEGEGGE